MKDGLSKYIVKEYFDDKYYIIKDCEFLLCIYIFVEGEAEIKFDDTNTTIKFLPGDIFGLMHLLLNIKKKFSLVATKDSITYRISITEIIKVFGEDFLRVFEILLIRCSLQKNKYFSEIAQGIDDSVLYAFEIHHYNKGEIVIEKGEDTNKYLYIILDGDIYSVYILIPIKRIINLT